MGKTNGSCILMLTGLLLIFSSCEVFDSEEAFPAYLRIENFELLMPLTNQNIQGSKSSKITDSWVYVNDNLLGVFEVPTTIPILEEGITKIVVRAGIKKNGLSSERVIYPFYSNYSTALALNKDCTYVIKPQISYPDNLYFWHENFDGIGIRFYAKNDTSGTISLISDSSVIFHEPNEKNKFSGQINFSDSTGNLEILSLPIEKPSFPTTYLELNYSTNFPLAVGVYLDEPSSGKKLYKMVLHPNRNEALITWNKTYIELTELVNTSKTGKFSLFFESKRKENVEREEIFIDNIKIVGRNI